MSSSNLFEQFRYAREGAEANPSGDVQEPHARTPLANSFRRGIEARLRANQPQLCSVCQFMDVGIGQTKCSVCLAYETKKRQQEFNTMEFLMEQSDLRNFSQMNTKISCSESAERPDFVWCLTDRVVILECDEQQHKYNTSSTCEREREYKLADALRKEGKYVIFVRFNPNQDPKRISQWKMYEVLGQTLRECFVTDDCKYAEDGVFRKYLGYDRTRIRDIEREYALTQRGALQESLDLRSGTQEKSTESSREELEWVQEFVRKAVLTNISKKMTVDQCITILERSQ